MSENSTTSKPGRTCPNCHAFVPQGNPRCSACKLEVRQMDTFAAAKKAAMAKGIRGVRETSRREPPAEPPSYLRPRNIALVVVLAVVCGVVAYYMQPKPPRYLALPVTAVEAARGLLTHVSTGTDEGYTRAYDMLSDSVRHPKNGDELADYRQVFHVMNQYLSGEFGADWLSQAKFAADPKDATLVEAKIGAETLRIHTLQEVPAERQKEHGNRFAVTAIEEFDVNDAAEMRKMAAITNMIGGVAGQGAVDNLQTILGASANNRHQPRMVKKMDLLAVNRNPRTATWKSIIQMYPLREDPVVRHRLTMITQDERYDAVVREKAQKVLTGRFDTDDPDLIAAGVPF